MGLRKIWGLLLCIGSMLVFGFYIYIPFTQNIALWKAAISVPVILLVFIITILMFLTGKTMIVVREPPKAR